MWIVRYAPDHRYTFTVAAVLILLFGGLSTPRMSTDIFPAIDIPTINVVWICGGLNASEIATKITSFGEIAILNNVDDIRATETQTVNGIGLIGEFPDSVLLGEMVRTASRLDPARRTLRAGINLANPQRLPAG